MMPEPRRCSGTVPRISGSPAAIDRGGCCLCSGLRASLSSPWPRGFFSFSTWARWSRPPGLSATDIEWSDLTNILRQQAREPCALTATGSYGSSIGCQVDAGDVACYFRLEILPDQSRNSDEHPDPHDCCCARTAARFSRPGPGRSPARYELLRELEAAVRWPRPRRLGTRRAGQVRDRGRPPSHRGRHGPALVHPREAWRLRDPGRLQDSHSALQFRHLHPDCRAGPRTPGMRSTTASRCRSWTTAAEAAAPARSTPSRSARPSPPRAASGTPWRSRSRATASSTAINGVAVAEFDSSELKPQPTDTTGEGDPARGPRPPSGYIGLQNHDQSSVVYFKEVSVRPLTARAQ